MTRFRLSPTMLSPPIMAAMTSLLLVPLMLSAHFSSRSDLPVPTISSAIVGNAAARA